MAKKNWQIGKIGEEIIDLLVDPYCDGHVDKIQDFLLFFLFVVSKKKRKERSFFDVDLVTNVAMTTTQSAPIDWAIGRRSRLFFNAFSRSSFVFFLKFFRGFLFGSRPKLG